MDDDDDESVRSPKSMNVKIPPYKAVMIDPIKIDLQEFKQH